MSLGKLQEQFSRMINELESWAFEQGYEIRGGDYFRDPRLHGEMGEKKGYGRANSLHKLKLAKDLNLFKDGVYLDKTEDHLPLGEKWESMGGSWGGRFRLNGGGGDGNHYSLAYRGFR